MFKKNEKADRNADGAWICYLKTSSECLSVFLVVFSLLRVIV